MLGLYNAVALPLIKGGLKALSLFNEKARKGLEGRRALWKQSRAHYVNASIGNPRVLIHVASFGELEQAKPVIEQLKILWPSCHIHLTFFSPSGFENAREKYTVPDIITYSPFDTKSNVQCFLDIVKPDLACFVRYDVWPNMAFALAEGGIPTILFSATYNEHSRRSLVESFQRLTLSKIDHILTVSESDRQGLLKLGIDSNKLSVAGDTRFDQVIARKDRLLVNGEQALPKGLQTKLVDRGAFVLVAGSSWKQDEEILSAYLKQSIKRNDNLLAIIVPHEPSTAHVAQLLKTFGSNAIKLSEIEHYHNEKVIIVDSIGKLFLLYQYGDAAFVGGGFGSGVHNVLEPAVWGLPVIVGPKHHRSQEVGALIEKGGAFEIANKREFDFVFRRLLSDDDFRVEAGKKAKQFVSEGSGATKRITEFIASSLH